ncbi:MAG TPA: uL13 family ribosomal protein, partial [bacterium]|nr:uL13 family ribosomal protein [bacterium]
HSGYAGGFRAVSLGDMLKNKPEELVADAVRGMLPKNSLGRTLIKHLRVYRGAEHPHFAQKPEKLEVGR